MDPVIQEESPQDSLSYKLIKFSPLAVLALALPLAFFMTTQQIDVRQRAAETADASVLNIADENTAESYIRNEDSIKRKKISSSGIITIPTPIVEQTEYLINLVYLKPKDQPERPDLQEALKREFNVTFRNWFGKKLSKTWKIGEFKYYVSTKNSQDFVEDTYDTTVDDLEINLKAPLFPQGYNKEPNIYTKQKEINVVYVQTNQEGCVYGTYYDFQERWGVSVEGGLHLNALNKTPKFDETLPPWNTTDPSNPYYNWREDSWIDPVKNPVNSWHCYQSSDDIPKPNISFDINYRHNLSMGVMAHETGHALGLDHPTSEYDWKNSVMGFAWVNWPNTTFSNTDALKLSGGLQADGRREGSPYITVVCDLRKGTCPLANPIPTPTPTINPCSVRGRCIPTRPITTPTPTPIQRIRQ